MATLCSPPPSSSHGPCKAAFHPTLHPCCSFSELALSIIPIECFLKVRMLGQEMFKNLPTPISFYLVASPTPVLLSPG